MADLTLLSKCPKCHELFEAGQAVQLEVAADSHGNPVMLAVVHANCKKHLFGHKK